MELSRVSGQVGIPGVGTLKVYHPVDVSPEIMVAGINTAQTNEQLFKDGTDHAQQLLQRVAKRLKAKFPQIESNFLLLSICNKRTESGTPNTFLVCEGSSSKLWFGYHLLNADDSPEESYSSVLNYPVVLEIGPSLKGYFYFGTQNGVASAFDAKLSNDYHEIDKATFAPEDDLVFCPAATNTSLIIVQGYDREQNQQLFLLFKAFYAEEIEKLKADPQAYQQSADIVTQEGGGGGGGSASAKSEEEETLTAQLLTNWIDQHNNLELTNEFIQAKQSLATAIGELKDPSARLEILRATVALLPTDSSKSKPDQKAFQQYRELARKYASLPGTANVAQKMMDFASTCFKYWYLLVPAVVGLMAYAIGSTMWAASSSKTSRAMENLAESATHTFEANEAAVKQAALAKV